MKTLLLASFLFSFQGRAEIPASLTPDPRTVEYEWMSVSRWYKNHADDVEVAAEGKAPLVFIGDSITEGWNGAGKEHWDKDFAPLGAANFGIGGDTTQNLLWRLEYGAKGKLDPKAVVLLIGTNNLAFTKDEPVTIAAGVVAVVDALEKSYPSADILLMGVFPRNESADDAIRMKINLINSVISKLGGRDRVTYLDISKTLAESDGSLSKDVMPDFLHLSGEGYKRWAAEILPWVSERVKH